MATVASCTGVLQGEGGRGRRQGRLSSLQPGTAFEFQLMLYCHSCPSFPFLPLFPSPSKLGTIWFCIDMTTMNPLGLILLFNDLYFSWLVQHKTSPVQPHNGYAVIKWSHRSDWFPMIIRSCTSLELEEKEDHSASFLSQKKKKSKAYS